MSLCENRILEAEFKIILLKGNIVLVFFDAALEYFWAD